MSSPLADEPVEPAGDDADPLEGDEYADHFAELGDAWEVVDDHHLEASYEFPDFETALAFTNEIGELAEREWHHPDISLSWGEVGVELWSHEVGGLTRADFVMAAKMDRLYADAEA
ncbi:MULTISPECIES: 4a-hydroxytetrahydrobiopterin dehydratase [Halorubrum]|uniref:Putative pterin-4-alpha-carbinolamine dehydratase n=1 Tax=Halorubrum hochstenium ATCC 700873 TaxID=1227481 RepID=M0F453_9EURY|nr:MULTISPECIES: 4a-hydroxytetrahydrobiopterin dehydratase [Halorubrum]ELZ53429.1 transcriptional coactivator/pterin dehydratase [Halorubrum hochstenium ATCC 700873]